MDAQNLPDEEIKIDPVRNHSKNGGGDTFYEDMSNEVSNGVEPETVEDEKEFGEENLEETEEKMTDKIRELKSRLKECEKQKSEYLAGWQRAKADFINVRKDEAKIREEIINFQKENILRQFLAVADSFEAAFKNPNWNSLDEKWKNGIEGIYRNLVKIFESYNIKSFESVGEKFDHEKHEAIASKKTEEQEKDQIIAEEAQKGYNIEAQILRPAKVKVWIFKS